MTAALTAVGPLTAAASKTSSGGSSTILIFLAIGAAFYFLIYRPQQKKQKAARAQANLYDVGDEVVTAGGIVGHVLDITDDRVTLETSVGASFVVLKPYVLRKLEPVEPPADVVDGEHDADAPEPPDGPPAHDEDAGLEAGSELDDEPHDEAAPTTPPPDADDDSEANGSEGPPTV